MDFEFKTHSLEMTYLDTSETAGMEAIQEFRQPIAFIVQFHANAARQRFALLHFLCLRLLMRCHFVLN